VFSIIYIDYTIVFFSCPSVPSPLFYNEDLYPDLLVRADVGAWDTHYTASNIHILDGGTGATLWSHHSDHSVMNSGVTVASNTHGGDAVFFYSVNKFSGNGRMRRDNNKPPDSFGKRTPTVYIVSRKKMVLLPQMLIHVFYMHTYMYVFS